MKTIKFKTSYETLISRCPGLFAYVELNEAGNPTLHKSTDSPYGCYGKIVENIKYCDINDNEIIVEDVELPDGRKIIKDKVYSYKTLMNIYYSFLEESQNIENFDKFKDFIEYHIGKIDVNFEDLDREKNDLVPYFIYFSTAKTLYSEMLYLKSCADFYVIHKENKDNSIDKQSEKELQCKCIMFIRKGGKGMVEFLKNAVEEAQKRSKIIYNNAKLIFGTKDNFKINYSINLSTNDKDLGILTPISKLDVVCGSQEHLTNSKFVNINEYHNVNLDFKTNSKLKSLKRFKNYINKFGDVEKPRENYDWLFYYRKGNIANLSTLNDEFGNIETDSTMGDTTIDTIEVNDIVTNLIAYGDIIENIELCKDEKAIKFTYWTDVHLIAQCKEISFDDDKNKKIKYENFVIDESYSGGIQYVETYYYNESSEINDLSTDEFNNYIKGNFDYGQNKKIFEKYEFLTYNNTVKTYKRINDKKVAFNSIISDSVKTSANRIIDMNNYELARVEFYNGISYLPTEEFDINIERGVTSVFDKHIRFSEIKNLNELEKFSNGGFYSLH